MGRAGDGGRPGGGGRVVRPVARSGDGLPRQTVGETGEGHEGFGGDDQRTSIFDYWSLAELNKWTAGNGLSEDRAALNAWYSRLLNLLDEPAFASGDFVPLNPLNADNPAFGRVENVTASGHWLYAYLRVDPASGSRHLVTVNLHPEAVMQNVRVRTPDGALPTGGAWLVARDALDDRGAAPVSQELTDAQREGVWIERLEPLSAAYWELSTAAEPSAGAARTR